MRYQTFDPTISATYPYVVLLPKLDVAAISNEYIAAGNIDPAEVIAYQLHQDGKKTKATVMREYVEELAPILEDIDAKYLICGDGEYFKILTGTKKADAYLGYVLPNAFPEKMAGKFSVVYVPNARQVFYDPAKTRAKIKQGLDALWEHSHGRYRDPGCDIISFATYPQSPTDIRIWLDKLLDMDCDFAADIEAFSLKHFSAGIGTISFAWSQTEGIAFPVDLLEPYEAKAVRGMLEWFFRELKARGRKLIWHKIDYDVSVLIYQLFMKDLLDTAGLLDGMDVMLTHWDCTRLITYLATNSVAGNELGLKTQAQEYSGNYAQEEINDIRQIPLPELLQYNLVDTLSTWFVFNKHWPTVIADEQQEIYETLFKPAMLDIIQMQLTGMPLDMQRVLEVEEILGEIQAEALRKIQSHKLTREFTYELDMAHVAERNAKLKKKQIKLGDEPQEFNPNSPDQMQGLLYELIGLPVIERTKTKAPATGGEVLEKLKAFTDSPSVRELLDHILEFKAVNKIVTAFIPAMKGAQKGPDGWHYLFGNFNLGGTLSGRLSSSDPNLQNLPANADMALSETFLKKFEHRLKDFIKKGKLHLGKLVKSCFVPPPGWLFIGLDFASLEDRISALTTKDPNKLKVYIDGYDGHSLRAHSYFPEKMPDIEAAPAGARCWEAQIGDRTIWFHEHEIITYCGQEMTGLELAQRLENVPA